MRDPHGYRWMTWLIFTPLGWSLLMIFHAARVLRETFRRKGRR